MCVHDDNFSPADHFRIAALPPLWRKKLQTIRAMEYGKVLDVLRFLCQDRIRTLAQGRIDGVLRSVLYSYLRLNISSI